MQGPEQEKKKKTARKSLAAATHSISKMAFSPPRSPMEIQLEQVVYAQSTTVDTIMKDNSDDLGRLITYLRQRVELEEGYQNSLDKIIGSLQQSQPSRDHSPTTSMHHALMSHVEMSINQRPLRSQYIQTIKGQLQSLAELKEQHDRARRLHRKNMRHVNNQYLHTRLHELPAAREAYMQKWLEIERMANAAIPSTPMSPLAPRSNSSSILLTTSASATTSSPKNSPDESDNTPRPSFSSVASSVMAKQQQPNDPPPTPMTPMTPTTQQRRIDRFVNKFSHLGNQHIDPAKQSARTAKLKVEVVEADKEYRKMVRKLDALSKRQTGVNEFAIKTAQEQITQKTERVKECFEKVMDSEATKFNGMHDMIRSTRGLLTNLDPERDAALYREMLNNSRYPVPEPIYYNNFHVGECRYLIFGTSLMEYAQQHQRSPPLLVSKCIEAIERQGGLEREGIYRISGKQSNIDKLKHSFEQDEVSVVLGQNGIPEDVFSVGSLLKIFLRDLATPLFPFKLGDRVTYSQIPDKELRLMNLLTRILKLPPANYDTLKVLIEHLARLEGFVEKNKMTIQNLSLMFTPAIFQDHNQAQRSPGEWYSDCVLEDLIVNCDTLFADKDLRGASAITGVIEYGFHEEYDFDLPSSPSSSMYGRTNSSPTESEPDYDEEDVSPQEDHQQAALPPLMDSSNLDQQPRFRAVSQDRGLKVDTKLPNHLITVTASSDDTQGGEPVIPIPPSINSATVPPSSLSWLSQDPNTSPPAPGLQRSATVGATLKRNARVPREGPPRRLSRKD
ncbi:hypothetical protein BJV82DRAFT_587562 [Fennellomyces sp. T-0311]|nr:hypothetical protein BJV82DRAFT_587562 [Fennellomyces sp. T-0311]